MVRRGSTVRVRQRALQKRRKSALFHSDPLAPSPTCAGYGALYGASRSRSISVTGEKRRCCRHDVPPPQRRRALPAVSRAPPTAIRPPTRVRCEVAVLSGHLSNPPEPLVRRLGVTAPRNVRG